MAEKYGPQERAALFVLMIEQKEIANVDLVESFGIRVTQEGRKKLNTAGLLESPKKGRRIVHRITPDGISWCEDELAEVEVPQGKGPLVNVVFEVLRCLARYLRAQNVRLIDVIRPGTPGEVVFPADLEDAIRAAYREIASRPQAWVRLAQLRPKLDGAEKAEVDQTLLGMQKTGLLHLSPDSDRLALTDADHAAAIRIGKEDKHLMLIEES
jgi:hypothetical protein